VFRLVSRVRAMRSSPVSAVAWLEAVRIGAGPAGGAVAAEGAWGTGGAGGACPGLSSRAREIRCSPVSAPAWLEDRGGRDPSTRASPTLPAARPTTDAPRTDLLLPAAGRWALSPEDVPPLSVGWTPSHSHQRSSCPPPLWPFPSPSCAGGRPGRRTRSRKRGRSLDGASGGPCSSTSVTRRRDKDKLPRRPRKRHRSSRQVGDPARADYTPVSGWPRSHADCGSAAGGQAARAAPPLHHDLTGNRPETHRSAHSIS
jgi:hypothetical protein